MLADKTAIGQHRRNPRAVALAAASVLIIQIVVIQGFQAGSRLMPTWEWSMRRQAPAAVSTAGSLANLQAAIRAMLMPTIATIAAPHRRPCEGSSLTGIANSQYWRGPNP